MALYHVFIGIYSLQVAVLNFSKSFSDYTNPGFVHVDGSGMTLAMTVPHDIVMTDNLIEAHIPIVSVSCFTSRYNGFSLHFLDHNTVFYCQIYSARKL